MSCWELLGNARVYLLADDYWSRVGQPGAVVMEEAGQFGVTPFSYDILDQEAAKISNLIAAVNAKCAVSQADEVARELFVWAEEMRAARRGAEAEFLYLHAINIWERHHELEYPRAFVSLRDYALKFLGQSDAKRGMVALMPLMENAA